LSLVHKIFGTVHKGRGIRLDADKSGKADKEVGIIKSSR